MQQIAPNSETAQNTIENPNLIRTPEPAQVTLTLTNTLGNRHLPPSLRRHHAKSPPKQTPFVFICGHLWTIPVLSKG